MVTSSQVPSSGGRFVSGDKSLPLTGTSVEVDACAGLARVTLRQHFENPHAEALSVTYKLPLPADGAVFGFSFTILGKRTVGVVEKKQVARERYEEALANGMSAALLEQERTSLFTQEIGNIPPKSSVDVEVMIDMPLAWLTDGYWEFRYPLAAAPRYLGSMSDDASAAGVVIDVADRSLAVRASLSMTVRDNVTHGRSPESPSHPLSCVARHGAFDVAFGSGNQVSLDRDVVVRWPVAGLAPSTEIDVCRPETSTSAFALLTIVPPSSDARFETVARDVTLLLDTSGSMSGEPLQQLQRITLALIDSLRDNDTLEMIEFSNDARAFRTRPEAAKEGLKRDAVKWVKGLRASGGTEMLSGIRASLAGLRAEAQKQIVLITDGLIGGETDVVRAVLAGLPSSSRFHAIGVGASANRSLIAPIARAGRGAEIVVGLSEDAERACQRLLSKTVSPALVDVVIEGSAISLVAPKRLPDLFAGSPFRAALELKPEGGEVIVSGRTATGLFRERLQIAPLAAGHGSPAIAKLFAREMVEDLEMSLAGGAEKIRVDAAIESIGLTHQIATRLTSWIAVSTERTVDPRDPSRRVVMPHELSQGMSAEGLGLRPAGAPMSPSAMPMSAMPMSAMPAPMMQMPVARSMGGGGFGGPGAPPPPPPAMGRAAPPASVPPRPQAPRSESARDDVARSPARMKGAILKEESESKSKKRDDGGVSSRAPKALSEGMTRTFTPEEPRALVGHVRLARDGEVTIEFEVDAFGVEFDPASTIVEILLQDGRIVRGTVDPLRSTHPGSYVSGTWLRVLVMFDTTAAGAGLTAVRISLFSSGYPHAYATVTSQA